jgi:NDP-sugar pyrophosphorylase family protein
MIIKAVVDGNGRDGNGAGPGRRAVILAGGKGTRLGPFTTVLPKPLLPIGDRAILELLVEQLRVHGFTRLTLAVGYLSHLIEAVFGDGSAYGVSIDYHHEGEPLGTAGALAGVSGLEESFLMLNGDVITTLDFTELVAVHQAEDAALTIATQVRRATIDFGVIQVEDGDAPLQNVTGYLEKPSSQYAVSMGVYVVSPRVLRLIEPGAYLDFPDLVLMALGAGERVTSFRYDGLWLDIGRHEDYEQAISAAPDLAIALKEAAARNQVAAAVRR